MVSLILLVLTLLILPSCQLATAPEPPVVVERQPEVINVNELAIEPGSVPLAPENTAEPEAGKTARKYVREGYQLLLEGKESEAQRALQAALRQEPQNKQAAMLLEQIETDPATLLGSESFEYRVRPNDTLTGLAKEFLGTSFKFHALAKYNNISNPSRIKVGQLLKIPGKSAAQSEPQPKTAEPPQPPAVAEPADTPVTPALPADSQVPPAPAAPPQTAKIEDQPATATAPAATAPPDAAPAAVTPPDAAPADTAPAETAPADTATPRFGRYYAVVIGIDAYAHLGQLNTSITDAMAVTQILEEQYGFNVIFLPDATRTHITKVLDNLRVILTPQDNLLIYYAGHGILDENQRGYWLPQDALPDVRTAWLPTSEITEAVKAMAAKHVMVIADSCYTGTRARGRAEAKAVSGRGQEAYLDRIGDLRSRTAMTSGGLQPVVDSDGGQHSVFAKAFLTALYTNGEVLEGQRLFAKMRPWIAVSSSQTPAYANIHRAEHQGGDFLFVPSSRN